jgi:hypothetical protein
MSEHGDFEAWKDQVYLELRDRAPVFGAGRALGEGNFEKVGFHMGAAYGEAGDKGGMLIGITITDDNPERGKHVQVECNWRTDSPAKAARSAIEAYVRLKHPYP